MTKQERESSSKAGTIISPEDQLDFQLIFRGTLKLYLRKKRFVIKKTSQVKIWRLSPCIFDRVYFTDLSVVIL